MPAAINCSEPQAKLAPIVMVIVMAAPAPSPFWISKANAPRQQASEDQYCNSQFMHAGLLHQVVHPSKMSADAWGNLPYAENFVLADVALLPRGCGHYCLTW